MMKGIRSQFLRLAYQRRSTISASENQETDGSLPISDKASPPRSDGKKKITPFALGETPTTSREQLTPAQPASLLANILVPINVISSDASTIHSESSQAKPRQASRVPSKLQMLYSLVSEDPIKTARVQNAEEIGKVRIELIRCLSVEQKTTLFELEKGRTAIGTLRVWYLQYLDKPPTLLLTKRFFLLVNPSSFLHVHRF